MFYQTVAVFGMLLVSVGAFNFKRSSGAISCTQCLHLEYELRNLPDLYRMIMDNVLSSLDMGNEACKQNTAGKESCPAPTFLGGKANKCSTATVTLDAVGITGILPDAEMSVTVVARDCIVLEDGESDGCTNLDNLNASDRAQLTQQLQSIEASWDRVSYSGEVCVSSP